MSVNARYLVLALLKSYKRPMERRAIHKYVHELAPKLGLELKFFGEQQPFSPELEREIKELVAEGLLKPLYLVGPLYTELYKEYYVITDKGLKALEGFSKAAELESLVAEYLSKGGGKQSAQQG